MNTHLKDKKHLAENVIQILSRVVTFGRFPEAGSRSCLAPPSPKVEWASQTDQWDTSSPDQWDTSSPGTCGHLRETPRWGNADTSAECEQTDHVIVKSRIESRNPPS